MKEHKYKRRYRMKRCPCCELWSSTKDQTPDNTTYYSNCLL